jgi:hypothetical protein
MGPGELRSVIMANKVFVYLKKTADFSFKFEEEVRIVSRGREIGMQNGEIRAKLCI